MLGFLAYAPPTAGGGFSRCAGCQSMGGGGGSGVGTHARTRSEEVDAVTYEPGGERCIGNLKQVAALFWFSRAS
jgi:hypothetical protein